MASPTQAPAVVTEELYALLAYLLHTSTPHVFRRFSELGLSMTQVKLLHQLDDREDAVALKDLADALSFSLPAASRAIEALHERGLVERRENATDRRMKDVRIAPAGRDVLRDLNQMRLGLLDQFTATLSDRERGALAKALAPIVAREPIARHRPE